MVLDGDSRIGGYLVVVEHLGHLEERVFPSTQFRLADGATGGFAVVSADDVLDIVLQCVVKKLSLVGLVDDQGLSAFVPVLVMPGEECGVGTGHRFIWQDDKRFAMVRVVLLAVAEVLLQPRADLEAEVRSHGDVASVE